MSSGPTPGTGIRVLLVDDDAAIRAGWRTVLDAAAGITVVAEAAHGQEAIERAAGIDVVLMDIRMPVLDGLEATRVLTRTRPAVRTIVVTTFESDAAVWSAMRAGAAGFVLKRSPAAELLEAIRIAHASDSLLFPAALGRIAAQHSRPPAIAHAAGLTPREDEVLRRLARGRSNAEIAGDLGVGAETVKTHVGNLLDKLGARDRTHAVVLAYELGYVFPGAGA
ncbi:response regulator transcription factor [Micrococcaceae bacterium RIT802]|nr:response regulator transcription factor [Micrococcaceae bacterium RIT 802]